MTNTAPTPTASAERAEAFSSSYPVTADGWVTYQRVPHPLGTALVQKRNGCTRTVMLPRR